MKIRYDLSTDLRKRTWKRALRRRPWWSRRCTRRMIARTTLSSKLLVLRLGGKPNVDYIQAESVDRFVLLSYNCIRIK